jgi:hypothetical protein
MTTHEPTEAKITVNGHALSYGQSMTVRVALASFARDLEEEGLGDDEHGIAMTRLYQRKINEIFKKMGTL